MITNDRDIDRRIAGLPNGLASRVEVDISPADVGQTGDSGPAPRRGLAETPLPYET